MAARPDKPIETYPVVAEGERPPLPPTDAAVAPAASTNEDKPAPLPFERLAFRGGQRPTQEAVPLDFPFERDGTLVSSVTVRRLAAFEVADLVDAGTFEAHGLWAIYAEQSGLPVGVLRGLMEDDCDRIVEVNRRFMPRAFREIASRLDAEAIPSSASPENGAPTSPA